VSYATTQNLIDRFGTRMLIALTDRGEVALNMINTGTVDRTLSDTDAMIDGHLAARYVLPVTSVPPLLVDLALQIAIYKLHVAAPDPKIEEDYKQALRSLKDISNGTVRLPIAGLEPAATGASGARITDRKRPLNAKDMTGFI